VLNCIPVIFLSTIRVPGRMNPEPVPSQISQVDESQSRRF